MNVTAVCERSGGWWAVNVPEVEGAYTQAKRLDQVPAMVADAVHLLTGTRVADIHVTLEARGVDVGREKWDEARNVEAQARKLQEEAAGLARAAVALYRDQGLSVRDIGTLLELSPQRVSQLQQG